MNDEKNTLMIIDDHPIIHDGLKTLLGREKDLEIVLTASSASEAVEILEVQDIPDLAIVDLSLGDSDGIYLVQRLRKRHPELRMLVYTMSEEKLFAERAATAGADGYVMKTSSPTELKEAIRSVLAGGTHFTKETLARVQRKSIGRAAAPQSPLDILSNREMDIFKLIGEGLSSASISERLGISRNTVDTHRINIKNKLELENGKALDRYSYEIIQQGNVPE